MKVSAIMVIIRVDLKSPTFNFQNFINSKIKKGLKLKAFYHFNFKIKFMEIIIQNLTFKINYSNIKALVLMVIIVNLTANLILKIM